MMMFGPVGRLLSGRRRKTGSDEERKWRPATRRAAVGMFGQNFLFCLRRAAASSSSASSASSASETRHNCATTATKNKRASEQTNQDLAKCISRRASFIYCDQTRRRSLFASSSSGRNYAGSQMDFYSSRLANAQLPAESWHRLLLPIDN